MFNQFREKEEKGTKEKGQQKGKEKGERGEERMKDGDWVDLWTVSIVSLTSTV